VEDEDRIAIDSDADVVTARQRARELAGGDHVGVGVDRNPILILHRRVAP